MTVVGQSGRACTSTAWFQGNRAIVKKMLLMK